MRGYVWGSARTKGDFERERGVFTQNVGVLLEGDVSKPFWTGRGEVRMARTRTTVKGAREAESRFQRKREHELIASGRHAGPRDKHSAAIAYLRRRRV